jgi:hypothetical protein
MEKKEVHKFSSELWVRILLQKNYRRRSGFQTLEEEHEL